MIFALVSKQDVRVASLRNILLQQITQSEDGFYSRRDCDLRCTFSVFVLLRCAQHSTTNKKSIIEERKQDVF